MILSYHHLLKNSYDNTPYSVQVLPYDTVSLSFNSTRRPLLEEERGRQQFSFFVNLTIKSYRDFL